MLMVSSRTHPGSVRTINEDVALWDPDLGLMAVADGMGGHKAGEVASRLAVDTLQSVLKERAAAGDHSWPLGFDRGLSIAGNRLRTALKAANSRVYRDAAGRADYAGMGTTMVAALAEESRVTYAGVGDSRIYIWCGTDLRQLTADDSWIVMLQKESGLGPGAFLKHPMRHVLTSVIGARADVDVRVNDLSLADGQVLLFCTDGLHGALPDPVIASILKAEPDLERAADLLVETAVVRDGSDNVTILLARHSSRV
jgi:serine/threonine protein phosphatase PrpC